MIASTQPKRPGSQRLGQTTSKSPFTSPAQTRAIGTQSGGDETRSINAESFSQSLETSDTTKRGAMQETPAVHPKQK